MPGLLAGGDVAGVAAPGPNASRLAEKEATVDVELVLAVQEVGRSLVVVVVCPAS